MLQDVLGRGLKNDFKQNRARRSLSLSRACLVSVYLCRLDRVAYNYSAAANVFCYLFFISFLLRGQILSRDEGGAGKQDAHLSLETRGRLVHVSDCRY